MSAHGDCNRPFLEPRMLGRCVSHDKAHVEGETLGAPALWNTRRRDGILTCHFLRGRHFIHRKQRMRSKRNGKVLIDLEYFRGFVEVLPVAFIALHSESFFERGRGLVGIGLGKRNSMLVEKVYSPVEPIIFAQDNPEITSVFPHKHLPECRARSVSGASIAIDRVPAGLRRRPLAFQWFVEGPRTSHKGILGPEKYRRAKIILNLTNTLVFTPFPGDNEGGPKIPTTY